MCVDMEILKLLYQPNNMHTVGEGDMDEMYRKVYVIYVILCCDISVIWSIW